MKVFTNNPHGFDPSIRAVLQNAQSSGVSLGLRCIHQRFEPSRTPANPAPATLSPDFGQTSLSEPSSLPLLPESRWSRFKRLLARTVSDKPTTEQIQTDQALLQTTPFLQSFLPPSFYQRLDLSIVHPNAVFDLQKRPLEALQQLHEGIHILKNTITKTPQEPSNHFFKVASLLSDNNPKKAHIYNFEGTFERFSIVIGSELTFSIDPLQSKANFKDFSFVLFHEIGHAVQFVGPPSYLNNADTFSHMGLGSQGKPSTLKDPIDQEQLSASNQLRIITLNKLQAFCALPLDQKLSLLEQAKTAGMPFPTPLRASAATLSYELHKSLSTVHQELFADSFALCTQSNYQNQYHHDLPSSAAFVRNRSQLASAGSQYPRALSDHQLFKNLSENLYFGHHTTAGNWLTKHLIEHHIAHKPVHSSELNTPTPSNPSGSQAPLISYQQSKDIAHVSADIGWAREFAALYLSDPSFSQSLNFLDALQFDGQNGTLVFENPNPNPTSLLKRISEAAGQSYVSNVQTFIESRTPLSQIVNSFGTLTHANQNGLSIDSPQAHEHFERLQLSGRNARTEEILGLCAQFAHSDYLQHQINKNQQEAQQLYNKGVNSNADFRNVRYCDLTPFQNTPLHPTSPQTNQVLPPLPSTDSKLPELPAAPKQPQSNAIPPTKQATPSPPNLAQNDFDFSIVNIHNRLNQRRDASTIQSTPPLPSSRPK